jgi:hypothetical protein
MTSLEFATQIDRLKNTFSEKAYPPERVKLIWRFVAEFTPTWLEREVDGFLATFKFAPVPNDFSIAAAEERERMWAEQKKQNAQEAKDFWAGTLDPIETAHICQMIRKRIVGAALDSEWESFSSALTTLRASG